MKKLSYLVLIFLSLFNNLNGQERLTTIESEGSILRTILHENKVDKYVLALDFQDSLYIYKMLGDDASLTSTIHVNGIFNSIDSDYKFADNFFLSENENGLIAIDLRDGSQTLIPFMSPDSYGAWRVFYQDFVSARITDRLTNERMYLDIDLATGIIDTLVDDDRRVMTENIVISVTNFNSEDSIEYIYIIDRETTHTTAFELKDPYIRSYDESYIYYFENKDLYKIDVAKHEKKLIYQKQPDVRYLRFHDSDDYYVLEVETRDSVLLFDKATDQSIWIYTEYSIDYEVSVVDSLVFTQDGFYNTQTNEYTSQIVRAYDGPPLVIGGKYVLRTLMSPVIDIIESGSYYNPSTNITSYFRTGSYAPQVLELETKYLVSFSEVDEGYSDLWEIPKDAAIHTDIYPSETLSTLNQGIGEKAKLLDLNGSIVLIDNDIYSVIDDEVVKLNEGEILPERYFDYNKIIDDTLFWKEAHTNGEDLIIRWTSGGKHGVYAQIPDVLNQFPYEFVNVKEYFPVGGLVYFETYGFEDVIYVYDRDQNATTPIDAIDRLTNATALDGRLYYYDNNSLWYLTPSGGERMVFYKDNNLLLGLQVFSPIFKIEDVIYTTGESGIYDISDPLNPILLVDNGDLNGRAAIEQSVEGVLLYNFFSNDFYLFDGLNAYKISSSNSIPFIIGDHVWIAAGSNSTIFNYKTGESTSVPSEITSNGLLDVVIHQMDTLLITFIGSHPQLRFDLIKASNNFQDFEVVKSIITSGRQLNVSYTSYGDEGLLYASDQIYLMKDDLEFVLLDDVTGVETSSVVEKDGYFYFLAYEAEYGRQLYRVLTYSNREPSSLINLDKEVLSIHPNPCESILNINNGNLGLMRYSIFDSNGRLIKSVKTRQIIDVSRLSTGFYFIQASDGDGKQYFGKFFKQ